MMPGMWDDIDRERDNVRDTELRELLLYFESQNSQARTASPEAFAYGDAMDKLRAILDGE